MGENIAAVNDFTGVMHPAIEESRRYLMRAQKRQKSFVDSAVKMLSFKLVRRCFRVDENMQFMAPRARK